MGLSHKNSTEKVVDYLINTSGGSLGSAMMFLGKIRDAIKGPAHVLIREMDAFANGIYKVRNEIKAFLEVLTAPGFVDEYWTFFAADTPESQLIRPDDYNFNAVFVHAPFWIALLLTKLSVPPPPFSVSLLIKLNIRRMHL